MRAWVVCREAAARRLFDGLPGVVVGGPGDPPPAEARCWIAWGVADLPGPPPGVRVVNRPAAVALLADRVAVRARLRRAGLEPSPLAAVRVAVGMRPLRVALFDLRPWAVEVLDPRGGRWRPVDARELAPRLRQRAVGAAIRALHALRLDAGRVTVAVGPPDRCEAVCRIELAPRPAGMAREALRQAVDAWLDEPPEAEAELPAPPLRLGCDPEFALVEAGSGRLVPASRFLPRAGSAGCDGQAFAPGQYALAEVRPAPSGDVRQLAAALRRCLLRAAARVPATGLIWRAGSEPVPGHPTGGHIHFSGLPLSGALLRALDAYLALPVALLEQPAAAARRRRRHGFLGDVRPKPHGGFEYRTLPSWLVSPRVAVGVLTLARWVALHHPRLTRDPFLADAAQQAFYAGDAEALRPWLPLLRADLEATPGFRRVAGEILPLLEQAEAGQPWDENADLRAAWGLDAAAFRLPAERAWEMRSAPA